MSRQKNVPHLPTDDLLPNPALEAAVTRMLVKPPVIDIAEGFAARVAQAAVAQPQPPTRLWLGWGPRLTVASGALLTAAMFVLAPHAAPSLTNLRFDAELVLLIELSGLALFSRRLLQD